MNITIIYIVAALMIGAIVAFFISKVVRKDSETKISTYMITSGIMLIAGAFPGTKEIIIGMFAKLLKIDMKTETDYVMIVCGFVLIGFGYYYERNIRDRIHILNMLGIPVQKEISDENNIKDLKLDDYKVKEFIIDISGIYDNNMDCKRNDIIVEKIKKSATAFLNRSRGFKSGFTGMAPIPYTIYAGSYLAGGETRRYFEYSRQTSKYYELKKKAGKRTLFPGIDITIPRHQNINATEVVVALSVTMRVQDTDLTQFSSMDIIRIDTDETKDNLIISLEQLDKYAGYVNNKLEEIKGTYPNLIKVHFVAAIPSCLSLELGKLFALNVHRLPQIIAYHYISSSQKKYPFGIVVADGQEKNRGKLVKR